MTSTRTRWKMTLTDCWSGTLSETKTYAGKTVHVSSLISSDGSSMTMVRRFDGTAKLYNVYFRFYTSVNGTTVKGMDNPYYGPFNDSMTITADEASRYVTTGQYGNYFLFDNSYTVANQAEYQMSARGQLRLDNVTEYQYSITYDGNGGSNVPSNQSTSWSESTSQYLYLSSTIPIKNNAEFLGWATTKGATEANYKAGQYINVSKDLTLYAVWKSLAPPIKVKIDGTWKEIQSAHVRVSGEWKEAEAIYVNVGGTWKKAQ